MIIAPILSVSKFILLGYVCNFFILEACPPRRISNLLAVQYN